VGCPCTSLNFVTCTALHDLVCDVSLDQIEGTLTIFPVGIWYCNCEWWRQTICAVEFSKQSNLFLSMAFSGERVGGCEVPRTLYSVTSH
jgi:hypothetical protein